MSELDDIFPGLPTGGSEFDKKAEAERDDKASLQTELDEQERIAGNTGGVFDKNRVAPVGVGDGGRVRIDPDHWGRK